MNQANNSPAQNGLNLIRRQLLRAEESIDRGDGVNGTIILNELLELYPNYFSARTVLARQKFIEGNISQALDELYRAQRLAPENCGLLVRIGKLEKMLGYNESADARFRQALGIDDNHQEALWELSQSELEVDDIDQAIIHLKRLDTHVSWASSIQSRLAEAYERIGQTHEASALYERLFTAPETPLESRNNAAFRLCSIDSKISDQTLVKYIAENATVDQHITASFAMANVLIRQGNLNAAWDYLESANGAKWIKVKRHSEHLESSYKRILAYCESVSLEPSETASKIQETNPIVICGPSRSGKSLVESILARSPNVCRGFESNILARAIAKASQESDYPQVSDPWHFDNSGQIKFSDSCRIMLDKRARGYQWITLTSPANIFHVGAAAQMYPKAVFVFITRNRLDLAARIYASDYAHGHSYSYDISSLRRYLDWQDSLVQCWLRRLNGRCVLTSYEEIVSDPGSFLKKMSAMMNHHFNFSVDNLKSDIGFGAHFLGKFLNNGFKL